LQQVALDVVVERCDLPLGIGDRSDAPDGVIGHAGDIAQGPTSARQASQSIVGVLGPTATGVDPCHHLPGGVELLFEGVADGRVRYSSQNSKNILFADTLIDDSGFTRAYSIQAADGGDAYIVMHIGD